MSLKKGIGRLKKCLPFNVKTITWESTLAMKNSESLETNWSGHREPMKAPDWSRFGHYMINQGAFECALR